MRSEATELGKDEELRMPATEEAAAAVFSDIDPVYFTPNDFDAVAHELSKLQGEELELGQLERERFKLKKQLRVVSKKISVFITQNSAMFCEQVQRYEDVRAEAGQIIEVVSGIREILQTEKASVRNVLAVLANDRRKRGLLKLRDSVRSLRPLLDSGFRLRELMAAGDFPNAIQLCVEAKNAAAEYSHYTAVRELSENLSKRLGSMESYIDDALAQMTLAFRPDKYVLIYSAYEMLGKTDGAAHKLLSFFHATLQTSARTVLVELLRRTAAEPEQAADEPDQVDQQSYAELCALVPEDFVLECVQELGLVLCKVLCVYHAILRYHMQLDEERLGRLAGQEVGLDGPPVVEKGFFQTVLIEGLFGVFETAAEKVDQLLGAQRLAHLKVDHFIQVLEMVNRFRRFGRLHFHNPFAALAPTLERLMSDYFASYHAQRMEEFRMFLEHEAFALCPVPLQFTCFDLPEFQFLKDSTEAFDDEVDLASRRYQREASELSETLNLIKTDAENPFLPLYNLLELFSYAEEEGGMRNSLPNVCNTALNLLKFFGRYIQMTSFLHSIADQVIRSIIQLYEYALFTMHELFARDADCTVLELKFASARLLNTVALIQKRMIDTDASGAVDKYPPCQPSPCIQLQDRDSLFSLAQRIVAVESLIFLEKQLEVLRPVLGTLLPPSRPSKALELFYKSTVNLAFDLRDCVYGCAVSKLLNFELIIKKVKQVKWDVSELRDQHSEYVDYLCKELSDFSQRLDGLGESVHLSADIRAALWTQVARCCFKCLVQGYAEAARKCSNEGRALMLLDVEHLNRHMEQLAELRPVPFKAHAEDYIKAYYLPESCLPDWISQHSGEYTTAQINAVLNHVSRVGKSRIMNIIEGKILDSRE